MNKREAKSLLLSKLNTYRMKQYSEFLPLMDEPDTFELNGESGVEYQIEIQAFWDDKKDGDIRVMGSIDNGGLRALFPLCEDFIMSPNGEFVDE